MSRRAGFGLGELVVAAAILATAMITLLGALESGRRQSHEQELRSDAFQAGQDLVRLLEGETPEFLAGISGPAGEGALLSLAIDRLRTSGDLPHLELLEGASVTSLTLRLDVEPDAGRQPGLVGLRLTIRRSGRLLAEIPYLHRPGARVMVLQQAPGT